MRSNVVARRGGLLGRAALIGVASAVAMAAAPATAQDGYRLEWIPVSTVAPEDAMVRLRLGMGFHGGGTLGDPEGWMRGGSARIGVQIGESFATYYQATAMYAGLQETARGGRDGAFVLWNAFLAETTLFHILSLAAGPSVDFYDDCDPGVQGNRGCADGDASFGLHGRVALLVGHHGPGRRGALSLSFEVHPTFFGDGLETVSLLGGLGVEMF